MVIVLIIFNCTRLDNEFILLKKKNPKRYEFKFDFKRLADATRIAKTCK